MDNLLINNKKTVRNFFKKKRKEVNKSKQEKWNKIIFEKILKNKLIIEPIAFYFSNNFEVDTRLIIDYLLKKKKKICIPRIINEKEMNFFYINNLKKDLEMNQKFNFLQPKINCKKIKPELIKTIFVPIIAYDSKNNRLGQGKGYYDYFLKNLKNIFKIGLAYKIQKIEKEIKFDEFDIKMDLIITN